MKAITNKPQRIDSIQLGCDIKTPCQEFVDNNITLFQTVNNIETHQEIKQAAKHSQSPDATPSFAKRVIKSSVFDDCLQLEPVEVRA